jgi:hypothetical protein
MRDTIHNETYLVAIPPVVVSDDTGQVGNWIDRSGYDSLSFAILTGTLADTDATFTVLMQEADASNYSDAYAVCEEDSLSAVEGVAAATAASFTFAADNATTKIGYIGGKRYVRITVTPSANSSAAPLAALAILGHPSVRPV